MVHVEEGEHLGDCLKTPQECLCVLKEYVVLFEDAEQEVEREGDREEYEYQHEEDGPIRFIEHEIQLVEEVADRVDRIDQNGCETL